MESERHYLDLRAIGRVCFLEWLKNPIGIISAMNIC